jgi:hypothetical protein
MVGSTRESLEDFALDPVSVSRHMPRHSPPHSLLNASMDDARTRHVRHAKTFAYTRPTDDWYN